MVKAVVQIILELAITEDWQALHWKAHDHCNLTYLAGVKGCISFSAFMLKLHHLDSAKISKLLWPTWHHPFYGEASQLSYQGVSGCIY